MDQIGTQKLQTFLLLVVAVLLVGIAVWFNRGQRLPGSRLAASPSPTPQAPEAQVVDIFRKAAQGTSGGTTREDCIRKNLGPERYALITLRPAATTPEDQFKILPCYQ